MFTCADQDQKSHSSFRDSAMLLIVMCITLLGSLSGTLQSFAAESTTNVEPASTMTPITSTAPPLKGGISKLETLTALKEVGVSADKLRKADLDLNAEAVRQLVQITEEPDIIGSTVIMLPVSFETGAYLPMRKKWVDFYMSQVGQLIPMVQGQLEEVAISDDKKADADQYLAQIDQALKDTQVQYGTLQNMTQAAPYDNKAIASETAVIHEDIKKLEEARKKLYRIMKK